MSEYFIKGTVSVRIGVDKNSNEIYLTPSSGFLTPEDAPRAIAFPFKSDELKALLGKVENKRVLCKADNGLLQYLITISIQQKPVQLHVDENWQIIGFEFPSP